MSDDLTSIVVSNSRGDRVTRSLFVPLSLLFVLGCSGGDADVADGAPEEPRPDESRFESIFDGEDLGAWDGDASLWRVEDGVIVGETPEQGIERHAFLVGEESYEDFELRLQFRLVDGEGNSGVQFRSQPREDSSQVEGYQADLGVKYWGCLYDEARRDEMLAAAPRELRRVLDAEGWNDYRIRAEADRVRLWINDFQTVDYREPDDSIPRSGILALQLSSGPPMRVEFRNIRILRLDGAD